MQFLGYCSILWAIENDAIVIFPQTRYSFKVPPLCISPSLPSHTIGVQSHILTFPIVGANTRQHNV